jgi:hypothetical protein
VPDFTYTGDKGRVYPSLPAPANTPEPGETYTLRSAPDDRWEKAKAGTKPKSDTAPEPTESKES